MTTTVSSPTTCVFDALPNVRLFPMRRSAHVAQVAMTFVHTGVVNVGPLVSDHIDFGDEHAAQLAC